MQCHVAPNIWSKSCLILSAICFSVVYRRQAWIAPFRAALCMWIGMSAAWILKSSAEMAAAAAAGESSSPPVTDSVLIEYLRVELLISLCNVSLLPSDTLFHVLCGKGTESRFKGREKVPVLANNQARKGTRKVQMKTFWPQDHTSCQKRKEKCIFHSKNEALHGIWEWKRK